MNEHEKNYLKKLFEDKFVKLHTDDYPSTGQTLIHMADENGLHDLAQWMFDQFSERMGYEPHRKPLPFKQNIYKN